MPGLADSTRSASWGDVLGELEKQLADLESLLTHHQQADPLAVAPWTPPTVAGPLPATLVERAELLLQRQNDLSDRLAAERDRIADELVKTTAPHPQLTRPTEARPLFLDTLG